MTRFFTAAVTCVAVIVSSQAVCGDDLLLGPGEVITSAQIQLSDQPSTSRSLEKAKPSLSAVNRLRQQRAAYQYNQRIARIEANAWLGHEPLRPAWPAVPMMSSRYVDRQTIVIPVYVP